MKPDIKDNLEDILEQLSILQTRLRGLLICDKYPYLGVNCVLAKGEHWAIYNGIDFDLVRCKVLKQHKKGISLAIEADPTHCFYISDCAAYNDTDIYVIFTIDVRDSAIDMLIKIIMDRYAEHGVNWE